MSSHEQGRPDKWDFLEVWADLTLSSPYLLLLLGEDSGACRVLDPAERGSVVFMGGSYDEARLWLLEDEYEQVRGRLRNQD